jgi:hypothetical protein
MPARAMAWLFFLAISAPSNTIEPSRGSPRARSRAVELTDMASLQTLAQYQPLGLSPIPTKKSA